MKYIYFFLTLCFLNVFFGVSKYISSKTVIQCTSVRRNDSQRKMASVYVQQNGIQSVFLFRGMVRNKIPKNCPISVSRNGITSLFLFGGMVRNEIPKVCLYFCSMKGNSQCFFYHGIVLNGIPKVFCSVKQPEFRRNKPSVPCSAEYFRLTRNM